MGQIWCMCEVSDLFTAELCNGWLRCHVALGVNHRSNGVLLKAFYRCWTVKDRRLRGEGHGWSWTAAHAALWDNTCSVWAHYGTKRTMRTSGALCYLRVYFLWNGVLLNPRMDLSQLLSLLLCEPGLEGLKHSELLLVFCQHLTMVPE